MATAPPFRPGSITKWSRLAGACAVVALLVPDGVYRWLALSLAGVFLVVASSRVPRQAWAAHKALLAALGCAVAAIWAAEFFDLSGLVTTWAVGLTAGAFVGVILFSAVRLIRQRSSR